MNRTVRKIVWVTATCWTGSRLRRLSRLHSPFGSISLWLGITTASLKHGIIAFAGWTIPSIALPKAQLQRYPKRHMQHREADLAHRDILHRLSSNDHRSTEAPCVSCLSDGQPSVDNRLSLPFFLLLVNLSGIASPGMATGAAVCIT